MPRYKAKDPYCILYLNALTPKRLRIYAREYQKRVCSTIMEKRKHHLQEGQRKGIIALNTCFGELLFLDMEGRRK